VSNKRSDLPNLWSEVIGAVAIALAIWAIVLVLASKLLDPAAPLTAGISIASSVVVAGVAAYGIGSWRKQARHRVRHDIAHKAIEASLEALARLALARSRLTDQIASFRSPQKGEEWDRDDRRRLFKKIDEVDAALEQLRTAHQLVCVYLDENACGAMKALVDLGREYTRATYLPFSCGDRKLSDDEDKRRQYVLRDWKDNPFTQELESARDRLLEELAPFLLSR